MGRRLIDLHRQIEAKNRLLEELALTDPLTGLPNRRAIEDWSARQLSGAARHGFSLWVVLMDLDHFKSVNDTYGHDAGDTVLKKFGEVLRANTRLSDICGRIGGEEFLLVLTHADEKSVLVVVERIRKHLAAERFIWNGSTVQVTASFGVAGFSGKQAPEFNQLVAQADAALYRAKDQGRNRVELVPVTSCMKLPKRPLPIERTRLPAIPAPCQACDGSRGPRMPICDGCGAQVNDAHIRQRIERLEMATRFRPVHISVLLIDAAPPARFEDYFYRAASDRSERSPASRAYFDGLVKCAAAVPGPGMTEEAALAEFQRHGFFLIGAIECAIEGDGELAKAIERAAPMVIRRVKVSYKPKSVAFLSPATEALIPLFQANDWADQPDSRSRQTVCRFSFDWPPGQGTRWKGHRLKRRWAIVLDFVVPADKQMGVQQ